MKNLPDMWGSALKTVHSLRSLDMYDLGETLQNYNLASSNPFNLFPPFKSKILDEGSFGCLRKCVSSSNLVTYSVTEVGALVNGNQVVTMNGNYLQINDDCRYTLVADFKNRTFSVAANIQNGKTASIAVMSGSQVIEILPDGQQVGRR